MKEQKIFKQDEYVEVYQELNKPEVIYKKYLVDYNRYRDTEDLKEIRDKLMAMKRRKEWPEFLIKPQKVGRLNKYSLKVEYPFIEGYDLKQFTRKNNLDLKTCAKFIRNLEEKIYSEKDFVFPDIANPGNIIVNKKENSNEIDFKVIDVDGVQFDNYPSVNISALISPSFTDGLGLNKCEEDEKYNKQLDIRSIYAIFYYIMNGEDYFYPIILERKNLTEYEEILRMLNIPETSSLYEKTMLTLDETLPNKAIVDSLFELIDSGYEFETYCADSFGFHHRLIKK